MKFQLIVIALCVLAQTCLSEKASFTGYKLVRIYPADDEQSEMLNSWEGIDFDIWNGVKGAGKPVDVFLSPIAFAKYRVQLNKFGFNFEVVVDDYQTIVEEEERSRFYNRNADVLTKYPRYADIGTYLQSIVDANPGFASLYSAGTTHENRELRVLHLKSGSPSKAVWLDCGIHAREWIAVATCLNFIDKLIADHKKGDATVSDLLKTYEFHIMPLVNPDGYEYTHSTNRMWRKNRRPNTGSTCIGTDLNRNWGYQWMVAGASSDPCQDTFAGPSANSEIETQSIQKIITDKGHFEIFLTLHSYGQYWMIPWAWGSTPSPHATLLKAKSAVGSAALKAVSGTTYRIGSVPELLYAAAGGSFDWTHGTANIKHSYCLELRPGSSGTDASYGFLLPESRIPAVAAETYAGLIALINDIKKSPDA